ncbi:UmuC protein [Acidocella sp. MX-AZ02]|nr:UmuC protein [Acidocella sp. MX-AZ02]
MGATKTIAKLANRVAKERPSMEGLFELRSAGVWAAFYADTPIETVWGIGGQSALKLKWLGVATIADFVALDAQKVRDALTQLKQLAGVKSYGLSENVG